MKTIKTLGVTSLTLSRQPLRGRDTRCLLPRLTPGYLSLLIYPRSERLPKHFGLTFTMRPTADTKYLFCCWVVLGYQSLNRFSEPPVGVSTFVDFSGLPPVIEGYEQTLVWSLS